MITFYLNSFHSVHKSLTILIFPTWINIMDIPCTIYVSKLDIYEILTQRSVCWPPGRQRLHWQFHIDVPKGKKKTSRAFRYLCPLCTFLCPHLWPQWKWEVAVLSYRKGCLDIEEQSTYRTWRRVFCALHEWTNMYFQNHFPCDTVSDFSDLKIKPFFWIWLI